jgi:cytochrome c553
MNRKGMWTGLTLLAAAPLVAGCNAQSAEARTEVTAERGRYLVASIGCGDCHSPKVMGPQGPVEDEARRLAGHPEGSSLTPAPAPAGSWMAAASMDQTAWAGPWGVSFGTNLTPDEATGIGSWSEETFVRSIKTGRHMGVSRPVLPPMPWQALKNLSDDDLRAIYVYLKTVPPVHNRVPEPLPPGSSLAMPRSTASIR